MLLKPVFLISLEFCAMLDTVPSLKYSHLTFVIHLWHPVSWFPCYISEHLSSVSSGDPPALVFQNCRVTQSSGLESLLFYYLFFKMYLFIFIQLQLSAFSPHPSTPPQPVPPPSPNSTLPLDFVIVSFIDPSPRYPLPTPLWLLLQCS